MNVVDIQICCGNLERVVETNQYPSMNLTCDERYDPGGDLQVSPHNIDK
jgi:hypothetical protein